MPPPAAEKNFDRKVGFSYWLGKDFFSVRESV